MKICGRCDKPIRDGEKYTSYPVFTNSGPGLTVYRHDQPCEAKPYQTTPVIPRH